MTTVPIFGAVYDLATGLVLRLVVLDIATKEQLQRRVKSGEGILFIPVHQFESREQIILGAGLKLRT